MSRGGWRKSRHGSSIPTTCASSPITSRFQEALPVTSPTAPFTRHAAPCWAAVDPELARNVYPASAEELREWHTTDGLRAIRADGATVGLLAIAPGRIGWIGGDEINEEVILTNGRGHAASAQAAWARSVAP